MAVVGQIAFFVLMALSLLLAMWKGASPERIGALVIAGMLAWKLTSRAIIPSRFTMVDPASLSTDLLGLLGFGFLALQARRYWPLWATSLQLLSLSAHFARWADIGIAPLVYAVMRYAPTYGVLAALTAGTIMHMQRMRSHGGDPAWQDWSRVAARSSRSRRRYSKSW